MDDPRRSYELRLLDQADKIRLVLVLFFVAALWAAPRDSVTNLSVAWGVVAFAMLYVLFNRFVLDWHSIRREGNVRLMAALIVCADILFISVFLWSVGPTANSLSSLLLLDAVFAAAFFTGIELALVVGIVCGAYLLVGLTGPQPATLWDVAARVSAGIVISWLAYALAETARRERARTERIVRNLTEGVILVTDRGDVAVVNPRIEEMLGVEAANLVGLNVDNPAHAAALTPLAAMLVDVRARSVHTSDVGARHVHVEGPNPLDIQSMTVPCTAADGEPLAWVIVCRDVTDVLSTVRIREDAIAVLLHELRGRLRGVSLTSEMLIRMADALSPTEREETMELLDTETRRLRVIIDRTLDARVLEDGAAVFEFVPVALESVARNVCDSLRPAADEKQVALILDANEDDIPLVHGDPVRLDQALQNLVENAIKFTPPRGEVRVSVTANERAVHIMVTDTGCGIPADRLQAVFEKFVRDQGSGSPPGTGGLGIGLHISRQIVQRHGGTIDVRSVQGEGSTFTIAIPLMDPSVGGSASPPAPKQ